MFAQVKLVEHDIVHGQIMSFCEIMLGIALDQKNIPRGYSIGNSVDPVSSAAMRNNDQLGKIMGVTDVRQVARMLPRGISLNRAQSDGTAVRNKKILSIGNDGLHKILFS